MHILENDQLLVQVEDHGAELTRLYDKKTGKELLWSADPSFWGYHAPVLFPFVGMLSSRAFRYRGVSYPMGQHGFARQSEFTCLPGADQSTVSHILRSDKNTRTLYPFDFQLTVTHTLSDRELTVKWYVQNPSAEETLYFSIGGHPGFAVPPVPSADMKKEDCYVLFPGRESLRYILVDLSVTAADPDHVYTMPLDHGYLKLTPHLFDIDTFIFEEGQVEEASLCGPDRKPWLTLRCPGFPRFGLWTKSDEAPFVCLEPWYGRLDDRGFAGELPEKTGILSLAPGEAFEASYIICAE